LINQKYFHNLHANFLVLIPLKKILLYTILTFFLFAQSLSQELYRSDFTLSKTDSLFLLNLPKLKVPDIYKSAGAVTLPYMHDNSQFPFFRSILYQEGYSCGQYSSIGYAYTYELNRLRNTPADTTINQYSPMFTWNFFNGGQYDAGVCFYYSFEAIKSNGHPNIHDYGGISHGHRYWLNGYEKYYRGMFNQFDEAFSIYLGDEEGIQTCKYWLYDHLEGSEYGGLAVFYTDLGGYNYLPPGTPEAGKCVVDSWGSYNGHSMTLVGWNDSIRYDYNNDGLYTNHIDINGDGEVNVKDWEIGGFKFVNSYDIWWADSGFCYVMYKAMAEDKPPAGIWNKSVYVQIAEAEYEPLITYKVKIKHSSRNKIKLLAGVSLDTTDFGPEYTLDYSIFNYQGGDFYMQGYDTAEMNKTIEIGLDATPLLSYVTPGEPAKFFFQVHEHDPLNKGSGEVVAFSLMDYLNGGVEVPCNLNSVPIANSGFTNLSVVHSVNPEQVNIITEELPPFEYNQNYELQMEAEGGNPPYEWDIISKYLESRFNSTYPNIMEEELIPGNYSGYVTKEIPFDFPFYGNSYNEVTLFVDGFLGFEEEMLPIPYQVEDKVLFRYVRMIAPFLSNYLKYSYSNDDEIWYQGNADFAAFRWKNSLEFDDETYKVDFIVYLYPDGNMEFYYGDMEIPAAVQWITGLSAGDDANYQFSDYSTQPGLKENTVLRFSPQNTLDGFSISSLGLLSAEPTDLSDIYNITVQVTDNSKISTQKNYQLSNGVLFSLDVFSGADDRIEYGETAYLNVSIKNISNLPLTNTTFNLEIDDFYIDILDGSENFGTIDPGETITVENAIAFEVDSHIPDEYYLNFDIEIAGSGQYWSGSQSFPAYSPVLKTGSPLVLDGTNGWLDPGETVDIAIPLINVGHAAAYNLNRSLESPSDYLIINSSLNLSLGDIQKGQTIYDTINVTVDPYCPEGSIVSLIYQVFSDPDLENTDSLFFDIGRYPVLVLDLDPNQISGPLVQDYLENADIYHEYLNVFPNELDQFRNLFVLLGRKFGQYTLSEAEGEKLTGFLLNGGNIYMEGSVAWYEDPPTSIHPMFQFNVLPQTWNEMDTLMGLPGTFTENMLFTCSGIPPYCYYDHYFEPISPAFSVLKRKSNQHNFTVASDNGTYKTIGSKILLGYLQDGTGKSSPENLLKEYLIFFGLENLITEVDYPLDHSNEIQLSCIPNPSNSKTLLKFKLAERETVNISVFDIFGNRVLKITEGENLKKGFHQREFDAGKLRSGLYIINIRTEHNTSSIKFVVSG
jgi:hypothetical protein